MMMLSKGKALRAGLVALLLSSGVAQAETLTVDAAGGSEFLTIQSAIDVADLGDVIVVEPGVYQGFDLKSKGLTVVGQRGVRVRTATRIRQIPEPLLVVLANLDLSSLEVLNCPGAVLLNGCSLRFQTSQEYSVGLGYLDVRNCRDMRVHNCRIGNGSDVRARNDAPGEHGLYGQGTPAWEGTNEYLEIASSWIRGQDGGHTREEAGESGSGGNGLLVNKLHLLVTRSTLIGGDGGDVFLSSIFGEAAGSGGTGASISNQTQALLAGTPQDLVMAGFGGAGGLDDLGTHGLVVQVSSGLFEPTALRYSSIALLPAPSTEVLGCSGSTSSCEEAEPLDPTLVVAADFQNADHAIFSVVAEPGAQVFLLLGSRPAILDDGGLVERRVSDPQRIPLGATDLEGNASYTLSGLSGLPVGQTLFAQAEVTGSAGMIRTNSIAWTVLP